MCWDSYSIWKHLMSFWGCILMLVSLSDSTVCYDTNSLKSLQGVKDEVQKHIKSQITIRCSDSITQVKENTPIQKRSRLWNSTLIGPEQCLKKSSARNQGTNKGTLKNTAKNPNCRNVAHINKTAMTLSFDTPRWVGFYEGSCNTGIS